MFGPVTILVNKVSMITFYKNKKKLIMSPMV